MDKRRQLPLPDGLAPSRRAPPALPVENDVPPPPVPSRPTPGRPSPSVPAVPTSSRPVPRPPPQQKVPIHEQNSVSDGDEDDSFESDGSSGESYEDMSGQDSQPPKPTPVLPSRGYLESEKKRPPVPPPKFKSAPVQEDVYDQAEVGPEDNEDEQQGYYDDMEVADDRQEEYADCEIEKNAPVAQELQETYDEFGGVGQDTLYQVEDKQEEEGDLMYQQCDGVPTDTDELYQIPDEDSPTPPPPPPSSAPSLPPPRPKFKKEETAAPPPPRDTAPKTYAPKGGVGIPAIAMGDIQNIKDRLKKVSVPRSEPEQKEPKLYTDSNEMKEKFKFFQQKEQEDDSDEEESGKQETPVLKSRFNKPLPPKPNRDVPRVPLKPVIKTDDVKQPNVQVKMIPKIFEESNIEKPNFLSQLKLKHVSRPGEISSQNDSSVHSHSNKAPIVRRDLSPVNPIVTNNLPRRTPPSHKPPERKTLSNHTEQDSRPIPSPRPGEKKSFLHDYLEAHPEVSDQRLTSKLNLSDSLPPLPSPVNGDLPPLSEIPAHNRDLPPLPTSPATPQDLPSRGKDGYTKVNVGEEENNNEDIYDDALSFEDPLLREKWYFGEIDRMVGDKKLKKFNRNGAYLLRKSTKGGEKQPYTLMVFYKNHVYNLKIRERNDNRVALGEEKPDEMSFKSVTDLIKHHQTNDVILVHRDGKQDTTLLEVSPPK